MRALNDLKQQGKIRAIANRHQTSLGNLAIAWLIAQPQTNEIVGVRNAEQSLQNAQAAEIKLSADEIAEIDAIGRIVTDHLDDDPVMWNWG